MVHQKKNRSHRTSKIVKSRQSYSNGHLAHQLFILLLSAVSMCMPTKYIDVLLLYLLIAKINRERRRNIKQKLTPSTTKYLSDCVLYCSSHFVDLPTVKNRV